MSFEMEQFGETDDDDPLTQFLRDQIDDEEVFDRADRYRAVLSFSTAPIDEFEPTDLSMKVVFTIESTPQSRALAIDEQGIDHVDAQRRLETLAEHEDATVTTFDDYCQWLVDGFDEEDHDSVLERNKVPFEDIDDLDRPYKAKVVFEAGEDVCETLIHGEGILGVDDLAEHAQASMEADRADAAADRYHGRY